MLKRIKNLIQGKDCELQERMFRSIIFVGSTATIIGITESLFIMRIKSVLILMYLVLLAAMMVTLFATFKYKKYDVAAIVLGIIIIDVLFPTTFFFSGGLNSGASVWLGLGVMYVYVMFKGVKFAIFSVLCLISYGGTYLLAYHRPELLVDMSSRAAAYIDSFFSILVVGSIGGFILKAHMKVFEDEHKLNIQQREEIEKNSASKNALFANMNHEIRTPINTIIGLNEMILRGNPSDEIKDYANDINLASKMLLSQVNDILDLSQMEMGRMKIIPVKYKTSEMFGELVELVRFQMKKKGLEFYVDIDKDVPSELYGDDKRIKQIILNILDNARKYTDSGSVVFTVRAINNEDGYVTLEMKIADTGIGIKKEDLEYIYESFNRFDEKENRRIVGTGLGLAITKQLLDLMNGEITVDSIYRKGSVFTVKIKQKIENPTAIGMIDIKNTTTEDGIYRTTFLAPEIRILVVDDNKMNLKVVASLLKATNMQIDVANSGEECLNKTKKKFYHVILLDYMMPVMDGVTTLKNIREQENGMCKDTAVIVLTGNAFSGAREMYEKQGFDGYIEKPIQSRKMEEEVLKFLPSESIEYINDEVLGYDNVTVIQKTAVKKRKSVYITTDCVCDIPLDLLEKYDIKIMYLYIKTPNGRFADTREIDSDSLRQYMTTDNCTAHGDSVTVEEYEEFFADALTKAERVIHISLGSRTGRAHSIAVAAAKGFDHVTVIDSGLISCGQGLVVLHAAKMALDGKPYDMICKSVEKVKDRINMRFIIPGAEIFYANGRVSSNVAKICKAFELHPYIEMKQSRPVAIGVLGGNLESAWKTGIRKQLRKKSKICKDIVYVAHAGCNVKQQEFIVNEILKIVPFDRVIIQKASFSSACETGLDTIGIAFYRLD